MNLYDFSVMDREGKMLSLENYRGQVVLVVNTATGCEFTPQYGELEDLYYDLEENNFEILDFPCNQFANQAPGTSEEIHSFCTLRFGITFPQFAKIEVNGENADPLFKWLRENTKFEGFGKHKHKLLIQMRVKKTDRNYKNTSDIKWNFTKFLIDRNGEIVARFEPTTPISEIKERIMEIL